MDCTSEINTLNQKCTKIDDLTALFKDMNLGNTECISAYRTLTRPYMSRPGVVIADMRCLRDKRAVLERKRYIRNIPQHQYVLLRHLSLTLSKSSMQTSSSC